MPRLPVALLVCALAATGCGKSETHPEASWSELAPASAAPVPLPDLRPLEEAIARGQQRLAQAPGLIALMNPMGGQTDIPEAARRTASLMEACRADQLILARISDQLNDLYPDLEHTAPDVVLWQTRAAAYRFREFALLELLRATDRTAKDLIARNATSPAELLLAAAALDGIKYPHEGAILLRRYLAFATEAMRRAAQPSSHLVELPSLLGDTRMMALAWGPTQWSASDAAELRRLVDTYRAQVNALPGPAGAAIGRLVNRWWEWGLLQTGQPLDHERVTATAADLRTMAANLPDAAIGLTAFAVQIESSN